MHTAAVNGSLVKYDSAACMAVYASTYVSKARNVLLVSNTPANYTYQDDVFSFNSWSPLDQLPYAWICGQYPDPVGDYVDDWDTDPYRSHDAICTLSIAISRTGNWTVGTTSDTIAYCLVEVVPEECSLRFSLPIMLIIIVANFVKVVVIVLVLLTHKTPTLVTLGDAVASFLERPDPYTARICLSTREDILKLQEGWRVQPAKPWIPKKRFWIKAASWKRWLTCYVL
jgi:hypothetical protein